VQQYRGADPNSRRIDGGVAPEQLDPPHGLEAEQALLGALFLDNRAIAGARFLTEDDFYDPLHRHIFRLTTEMIEAGKIANPVTLAPLLRDAEPIDATTSAVDYLVRLGENTPTIINVPDYAATIREAALARALVYISETVADSARHARADFPIGAQIEEAVVRLRALSAPTSRLQTVSAASFAGKPIPSRAWQARACSAP
jgi:replicative DNA helicase